MRKFNDWLGEMSPSINNYDLYSYIKPPSEMGDPVEP